MQSPRQGCPATEIENTQGWWERSREIPYEMLSNGPLSNPGEEPIIL